VESQETPPGSIELHHFQALKALALAMREAIVRRDLEAIGRITEAQAEATAALQRRVAAGGGQVADLAVRRLAGEVRAMNRANEDLLRENLEVIDRIVRAIARAPDPGTYAAAAPPPHAAARRATALLDRRA